MSDANEVAEDYRLALEDLSSNMRFEISNLTVIARENTEHALTIADVLQQHILKAAPSKKLPALYVLDSIVKNVGTPYTLYIGRNLFKIFMESYAVVDNPIRKKMEEMLRTWKDPVPGSMDTRPVFSHELVRPIENALMKVRAASMPQQGPIPGRPRPGMFPPRDTPTPPGMRGQPGQYPPGQHPPPGQQYANGQQPSQYSRPSPQPYAGNQGPYQQPVQGHYGAAVAPGPGGISVDNLPSDIQNLIAATQEEASQFPQDASIQTKLKALMDLQIVVQRGGIPPDQLELIKNKVTELASVPRRATSAQPPSFPAGNLPHQLHHGHTASVTPTPPPVPQQAGTPLSLDSLLGQGALAALMARTASGSQNSTPNPPAAAFRSPPPQPEPVTQPPAAQNDPMALLNRLRAAGMLSGSTPTHTPTPPPPPPQASGQPMFPANLASILAMAKAQGAAGPPAFNPDHINVMFLKQQFRPDLINKLYDALGPPCTQCGRRFKTDDEGRKKKTAHMDWHFKVHQRSAEAEKRGMHRSWYVDQQDWLKSREIVDSDHVPAPEDANNEASKAAEGPKYIPVPEPGSGINTVCPICQEKFENKWLDTAQEWVWLDAVLVRNRAFHASCLAEASRDRDGTPRRTPEPVLGKRKAESSMSSPKIRTIKPSY